MESSMRLVDGQMRILEIMRPTAMLKQQLRHIIQTIPTILITQIQAINFSLAKLLKLVMISHLIGKGLRAR